MQFTYDSYLELLKKLRQHGYVITDYDNWKKYYRCVVLRHDIDYDLAKAVTMANLEHSWGVSSTYFVLLTSDFYNIFSYESTNALMKIISCGHKIGLHFDEACYPQLAGSITLVCEKIIMEARLLEKVVGRKIEVVSMHRPSKNILESDIQIPGMINSYGREYFRSFKYLSDSRRRWREPVEEIVSSERHSRLHILTHAFWYNDVELDIHDSISAFVNNGNLCRYYGLRSNISSLYEIMKPEEVICGGEMT